MIYSITIGFIARRKASRGLSEFFLAGRSLRGWQAGTSMAATQFAADTPLAVMGLIATGGIFMVWRFWIYAIAFLLMAFLLAGQWQRARVITDAELVEVRYSGRGMVLLRVVKALYYGTLFNCVVLAMVLTATLTISEVFLTWHQWLPDWFYQSLSTSLSNGLGLQFQSPSSELPLEIATTNNVLSLIAILLFVSLYSLTGGLRSVVATDIAQFVLAIVGTIALAWVLVGEAGGLTTLTDKVTEMYPSLPEGVTADSYSDASQLLSFSPGFGAAVMPFLILLGLQWFFQINADGTGYLAQRSMACRDEKQATIAGVVFTWLQIFVRSLPWLLIGVALLVLYPFAPADTQVDGFTGSRERLFVVAIHDYMPPGLLGILLVALLAALASTLDTHMNWGASYWSNDIYKRAVCQAWLKRDPGNKELVLVARLSNILVIALALIVLPFVGSIQEAWYLTLLFGAGVGSVLVLRWVWDRINLWSEFAAIIASVITAPILLILTSHGTIAAGEPGEWIRLGIMALVSTAAAVIAAFVAPRTDREKLNAFYKQVQPAGFWGRVAQDNGEDKRRPLRRLGVELGATAVASASVFFCLYGAARLLIPAPDGTPWWPLISLVIGLALIPIWWRQVLVRGHSTPVDRGVQDPGPGDGLGAGPSC